MLESGNPNVNVDELAQRVRDEVARVQHSRVTDVAGERILTLRGSVNLGAIESWVAIADQKTRARTKWPNHLHIFPFTRSGRMQGFVLKVLAFVFKDQRQANEAFIAAFRESIILNRQLIEQLQLLRDRVEELERR
jgi:O-antigen chain-terminating methyltransferase